MGPNQLQTKPKNLPEVINRTYKTPDYLQYDWDRYYETVYDPETKMDIKIQQECENYDTYWKRNALKIPKETSSVSQVTSITDIFARRKGTNDWVYRYSHRNVSKQTKYPCIGGPLNGMTATIETGRKVAYVCYNYATSDGTRKSYPKCVLVFEGMIPDDASN